MHRDPEGREGHAIREILGLSAGDLLEVGCGDGRLTREFASVSGTVTGLDPAWTEVAHAMEKLPASCRLLAGSGEQLPMADRSFDTVVFSLSLHHQDAFKAMKEARRVLRDGGRILILEPVAHSLLSMLFSVIQDESGEYEKAEAAIDGSELREIRSGFIRSTWVFEDLAEMTGYMFSYFDLEPDEHRKGEMEGLLGERRHLKPLSIEDITRYWYLTV